MTRSSSIGSDEAGYWGLPVSLPHGAPKIADRVSTIVQPFRSGGLSVIGFFKPIEPPPALAVGGGVAPDRPSLNTFPLRMALDRYGTFRALEGPFGGRLGDPPGHRGFAGSAFVPQPIMPLDLPVNVRSWELTVYPRSHIRRWLWVTRPRKARM